MEFVITIAIVAAAATFVLWRWVRSARQALRPAPPGACGGGCAGCTVPLELRTTLGNSSSPRCDAKEQGDAAPTGVR